MPTLTRALVDYDPDLLQVIAAQWDVDLSTSDRAEASEQLAEAMAQPEAVTATWERLTPDEQRALADLLASEGRLPFSQFTRRYGEVRPMGPARREREKPWLSPASVTEALYYRGLIVRAFEHVAAGAQEFIAVPQDLLELLPRPEDIAPAEPGYAATPPRRVEGGHPTAPDDICTLLAYLLLRDADARAWLVDEPVEVIDKHLRRPSVTAYRAMLTRLAYDLNLIEDTKAAGLPVTRVNRDAARPWLEAPRTHQLRSLAETWLASTAWNDLIYTPGLEADEWPLTPIAGRRVLVEMLADIPAGVWWSLSSFVTHVARTNPDFQRPGGDYGAWYLRDAYTGEILQGFESWDAVEGAMIRFIVEGPLNWLGLARVGHGSFELTPLALALQGRTEWPDDPDPAVRVRVDTQGLISVPAALRRYDRLQIARFAAWISPPPPAAYIPGGESRDEGAFVYRLTPQAISRILEQDISIETHIIPFLQRVSHHTVPANVIAMLESWHSSPREVIVHDVVIFSARDLGVYERVRKSPRTARLLGKQIGPHANIVRREDMPRLLDALRDMGLLPLFEGHEKDDSPL